FSPDTRTCTMSECVNTLTPAGAFMASPRVRIQIANSTTSPAKRQPTSSSFIFLLIATAPKGPDFDPSVLRRVSHPVVDDVRASALDQTHLQAMWACASAGGFATAVCS